MALLKYSALVAEARGKLGDAVLSRNQYGAYVRGKGILVDTASDPQLAVRARMIEASQAWRTLTDAQRRSWGDASERATRHNVFGDNAPLTGNAFFVKKYLRALAASVTPPTDPPGDAAPGRILELNFTTLSQSGGIITNATPSGTESWQVAFIWACTNISAGRTFVSSQYRLVSTVPPDTEIVIDITLACQGYFGLLVPGQRAFLRMFFLHITSLTLSAPISTSQIIAA